MWEETGESRPDPALGRAPRYIVSVCGAALLGNLWGALGPPGPGWIAVLIAGLLRGVVMQYLADARAFDRNATLETLKASALAGLKA